MMTDDLKKACEVMRAGGIILYPTDTVWGIGCDATNEKAVERVYELKQRVDNKAMLVLLDNPAKLEQYVESISGTARLLIEVAAGKPLTIIYPQGKNIAPNLLAADGSIGIRITSEDFSRRLCERFRKPLVSTSANISGEPAPSVFKEISDTIKEGVDYIVQYRQNDMTKTKPSGVIKLDNRGRFQIIR
jgi:L-threonylcarbamoyladenylate synthase